MKNKLHYLIAFCLVLLSASFVYAGSIIWKCPVCNQTLRFDPRMKGYANSMKQQHLADLVELNR